MFFANVGMHWSIIYAPLLFIELILFGTALAFFLSATYVRLRDIGHIWDVVSQALFYATPILFPLTLAPIWAQKIIMLNPLAQTIQDLRHVLVSDQTKTIATVYGNQWIRIVPVAICIIVFIFSALYFRGRSKYFAEEI